MLVHLDSEADNLGFIKYKKDPKKLAKKMGLSREDWRPNEITSKQIAFAFVCLREAGMTNYKDQQAYADDEGITDLTLKQAKIMLEHLQEGDLYGWQDKIQDID